MAGKVLPIGIQGFEKLRLENFLYVDKTEYIHELVHDKVPFFLSRPRRFGKSLLLSAIKLYFEGKSELFKGLAIERLERDNPEAWQQYPVFYFDFNGKNYAIDGSLEEVLDGLLRGWERLYGDEFQNRPVEERFIRLLEAAHLKIGRRAVVLIDEYDKPLLDVMDNPVLLEHNRGVFKGFFSTLKSADEHIEFIFITGVTKFHKNSIFSDLNQLKDISLTKKFASICGITEKELKRDFGDKIMSLAESQDLTLDECLGQLKQTYDGYRFHQNGESVYNPYSLFNAFYDGEFGSFWFETGTPAFLVKRLRDIRFDVRKFIDKTLFVGEGTLKNYTGDSFDPILLLYQSGYLTIADYDKRRRRYTLCFPNEEVEYGFVECMLPDYVSVTSAGRGLDIFTLDNYIETGNVDGIRDVLTALFASIVYTAENDPFEHYFQAVIYLVFTLFGKFAICEMHTFSGRIDCKVETGDFVYLFEFKRDDTAEAALRQIDDDKDYCLSFKADARKLFKIGAAFDSKSRMLTDWRMEE